MADYAFVPELTALINVDMQNCFVHRSPFSSTNGLAVQERINRVAAACRAADIPRRLDPPSSQPRDRVPRWM